jgi:hypothetical protein
MLKTWLNLAAIVPCVLLLCSRSHAQEIDNQIIFLRLRADGTGLSLLRAESRPGHLKPLSQVEGLQFQVSSPDGTILSSGSLPDPLLQRMEYPDASDPGALRSEWISRDSAEFTVRVPGNSAGGTMKFFRRAGLEGGRLRSFVAPKLIGEIVIPKNPDRLQAFATSARRYTLLTNGPTSARLNIAILAEGFTSGEETTFTNRARTLLNRFLAASPYREYQNHFNGFAIFVPSTQSGSDHPSAGSYRDTYFNSSYGTGGLVRLITIPPNSFNSSYSDGLGKVNALLEQFLPEYDIVLLLVNDSEYGGSGGFPAIASIHESSSELALHEIAHSFADLADEYDSPAPGYPEVEKANTTRETRRDFIKWRNWINASTPIPTPETTTYANVVGLFEGAYFHTTDWFRPKLNCRMNTLGVDFCQVCKEAIVLSAYTRLNIIQTSSPAENNLTVPGGGEIVLEVGAINPSLPLAYNWTIDGVTNSAYRSNTFPASFATLGLGTRLVRVSVSDPTPLVRTDTLGKLWKTRNWLVQVLSETNQPPVLSAIPGQFMEENELLTVNFTVSDPDTSPDSLQITVHSSNTNIIADADIQLGGTGTNRWLSFASHCGGAGMTTLTLNATDGVNTNSISFPIFVEPDETPMMIHPIPDQKTFSGSLAILLQISFPNCVSNATFFFSSSDTNLLPTTNISIDGTGMSRTMRLNSAPGRSGSAIVTVRAFDGNNLTTTSFTVTFLKPPIALASAPQITPQGIRLQFASDNAATLVLEHSVDFDFWSPVLSLSNAVKLDHVIPNAALGAAGFYRLRLLPL